MSRALKAEMIKGFIEEVTSYIPSLTAGLESLKAGSDSSEVLEETHRLVHTVKGASSMVGLAGLSHIAFQMEEYLDEIIAEKLEFSDEAFKTMHKTIGQFQEYCRSYMDGGVNSRVMLQETVLAFRRIRGLAVDEDEQVLSQLLDSVPECECLPLEEKPESEKKKHENEEIIEDMSLVSENSDEFEFSIESVLENEEHLVEAEKEIPPEKKTNDIPPELLESFYEEAEEHLEDLGRSLNALESRVNETVSISSTVREEIRRIRRAVHTLKGAAAVIGFQDFAAYAHSTEDLLDWLYEEASEISPKIVTVLAESSDLLEQIIEKPQEADSSKAHSLKIQYGQIMDTTPETQENVTAPDEPAAMIDQADILPAEKSVEESNEQVSSVEASRKVEVSEPGTRFTKTLRVDMARVDDLVNLAGEQIIALSAFDQKMDLFTEAVNDLELSRGHLKNIARQLEVSYEVKALEQLKNMPDFAVGDSKKATEAGGFDDFDSLELDRYSELNQIIRMLNESAVDVGTLHTQLSNLYSDFDGHLTRQRVILGELQDKMMRVRMTPMSLITNRLQRTVREIAGKLNKKVKLVITGENIELDRLIWEKITDPLMHLLRNAIDHGVEPEALRQSQGKSAIATVKLDASREGNQVVIHISDDGSGLNHSAIKSTAQRMGLSEKIEDMSKVELAQFIFYPGFSTRAKISEISGRGVGMDVVKENIHDLKGVIQVASEEGQGTRFTIRIPLTLAAVKALLFTAGEQTYAVALNEISEIIRLNPKNVLGPNHDAIRLNDEGLPLFRMVDLLNAGNKGIEPAGSSEYPVTLVVETGGRRGALVVDTLMGQREVVIKSLGSHLRYVKGISGATIMGDGSVIPILNIAEFLWSQTSVMEDTHSDQELRTQKPLKILVVDDSVSVRQVVSRLMQDQGWKVQTAIDGIDAQEKLRESRPDLIVLDIEMPRMNGYEFLEAIKAQAGYEDIPVVMLTSRTASKHREKAMALGVSGFMAKPYRDDEFVRLVIKLTGRGSES
ncbi:Signal transduction histidine kinase CheA [Olavius sp. associated proteobacterium Delta 1]|nr:Signal transduction histidine kinase CheA [Olavius sp. associated proteobacterium Delta 1]